MPPTIPGFVTLSVLAKMLHCDKSNLRKYIKKKGLRFRHIRTQEHNMRLEIALTGDDARQLLLIRVKEGFPLPQEKVESLTTKPLGEVVKEDE